MRHRIAVTILVIAFSLAPVSTLAQTGWSLYGPQTEGFLSIYGEKAAIDALHVVADADGWTLIDQGTTDSGKRFVVYRPPADWKKTERLWHEAQNAHVAIGPMMRIPNDR